MSEEILSKEIDRKKDRWFSIKEIFLKGKIFRSECWFLRIGWRSLRGVETGRAGEGCFVFLFITYSVFQLGYELIKIRVY